MKDKAVIRFSKFQPDSEGHGGHKRTAQLFELFRRANVYVIDFKKQTAHRSLSKKLECFFKSLKIIYKYNRYSGIKSTLEEARIIGHDLYSLETILYKSQANYKVVYFIWEYTWSQYWYMPLIARQLGLKVIGVPHNLESLVYSQRSHKPKKILSPLWLDEEIEYLNYANKIYCISREEQWLLSFNINPKKVHYLPYYPSKENMKFLLHIREERLKRQNNNNVMILGSAVNPPTLKGILELKKYLIHKNDFANQYDFVGYGVKWVKVEDEILPENFIISESVINSVLKKKLLNTSCVLINQIPSSGALTKIQDMRIAGIPVIVNSLGARSYYNIEGVYVYETLSDLDNYLNDLDKLTIPRIPEVDIALEEFFISQL